MLTRREFGKIAVAGLALPRLAGAADSKVAGVRIAVQTYSYRDLPRPVGASDSVEVKIEGVGDVEVMARERLEVRLSGAGNVRYRGDPKVRSHIDGAGTVGRM